MSELSKDFDRRFAEHDVPPLPKILSMVSMSTHQQSANHFYGTIVGSKDRIPLYQDVVVWMLKHDLLITLHLRIRVVATEELKHRVRMKFETARAKRERIHAAAEPDEKASHSHDSQETVHSKGAPSFESASESSPDANWLSFSPKTARALARRQPDETHSERDMHAHGEDAEKRPFDDLEEDLMSSGAEDVADWYRGNGDDNNPYSSMITDPARASRLERRWLTAMSEGKDPYIAARFERCAHRMLHYVGVLITPRVYRINQYFDGKCTDDEILYTADISRKDLREVLHHYEEYVSTCALAQREALTFHKSCKHSSIHPRIFHGTLCTQSSSRSAFEQSKKPFLPSRSNPGLIGTSAQNCCFKSIVSSFVAISGAVTKNLSWPDHLPFSPNTASKNASAPESSWTQPHRSFALLPGSSRVAASRLGTDQCRRMLAIRIDGYRRTMASACISQILRRRRQP